MVFVRVVSSTHGHPTDDWDVASARPCNACGSQVLQGVNWSPVASLRFVQNLESCPITDKPGYTLAPQTYWNQWLSLI